LKHRYIEAALALQIRHHTLKEWAAIIEEAVLDSQSAWENAGQTVIHQMN